MNSLWKHICLDKNDRLEKINAWSPFLVFFIMMFIAAYVGEVPIKQTLALAVAHIAFMLVPGLALVSSLQLRWKSSVSFLSISYFSGYCLCIIAYIVFLMLGVQAYSWIYGIFAFLIGAVALYRVKEPIMKQYEHAEGWQVSVLLAIAFLIAFIAFILANRSAMIVGYHNMIPDNAYWFKNSVAVTKGYPLPEISVLGLNLYWHVFSNFQIAFLHFATGIEIYDLCFSFSCIWQLFILVTGTCTLFRENSALCSAVVCCAVVILVFTQGNADKTHIYYLHHFYTCPLGCSEGQGAAMFGFVAFTKTLSKTRNIKYFIWVLMLFICTLGLKAPYGCILLVGIGVTYLLEIINGDRWIRLAAAVKMMAFISAYFLITQLFIIDNNALMSQTSIHQLTLSLSDTLVRPPLGRAMWATIKDTNWFIICLLYPVMIIFNHLAANGIIVLVFLFALIRVIYKKMWKEFFDISNMSLFVMTIIGCGLFQFVSHRGFSQAYFLFIAYPFALLWALNILNISGGCALKHKSYRKKIYMLCSLMTVFAVIYTVIDSKNIFRTDFFRKSYTTANFDMKATGAYNITDDDIEGLRWIRDNLYADAVIVTNKVLKGGHRTFITSAYAERQVYLDGYDYANIPSKEYVDRRIEILKRFYTGDISSVIDLANDGVDYAVLFKFIEHYNVVPSGLPMVYENDDISVYKIK